MKILFLSSSYTSCIPGHWQNWSPRHELAKDLTKKGHEVFAVTPRLEGTKKFEVADGVHIYRFGNNMQTDFRKISLINSVFYMVSFFLTGLKVAKKHDIDVIHAFWAIPGGYVGYLLSKITGKPYIVELLGNDVFMAIHRKASRGMVITAIDKADYVISDGWSLIHYAEKHGCKKMKKVFVHFYEPVLEKANLKSLESYRNKWNLKKSDKVIMINRIKLPHYGAEFVIQALPEIKKEIPEIKLLLVGGAGDYQEKIDSEIKKLVVENEIRSTGYLDRTGMSSAFELTDIYINPSLSDSTSVGLLEAMAARKAIIASDIGDNAYWVKTGENGIIVKPSSPEEIAKAVIKIFKGKKIIEMGKISAERIRKECGNEEYLQKQDKIYNEVLRKR